MGGWGTAPVAESSRREGDETLKRDVEHQIEYFHAGGSMLCYVPGESSSQPGSGGVCWRMKVGGRRALGAPTPLQAPGTTAEPGGTGLPGSFGPSSHLSSPESESLSGI